MKIRDLIKYLDKFIAGLNISSSVIIAAIAALAVVAAAGAILIAFRKSQSKLVKPASIDFSSFNRPANKSTRTLFIGVTLIFVATLLIVFIFFLSYSNKSPFCKSCHKMRPSFTTWKKSNHKHVACVKCHIRPGLLGAVEARARGLRNYSLRTTYYSRFRRPETVVSNSACLICHDDIEKKTVFTPARIKVSHRALFTVLCVRCHNDVGHRRTVKIVSVKEVCASCHDAKTAFANCGGCHKRDIGYKSGQIDKYPRVKIGQESCSRCHAPPICSACHKPKDDDS